MAVLGMVEYKTIATGIRASDAMVKAAPVDLIESRPTTPGKYISLVTGDVASVDAAVKAGRNEAGPDRVIDSFVLANMHDQVLPAIAAEHALPDMGALGIVETATVASIILATDAACKTSPIQLVCIHLALHINGKGYTTFVGEVADVEAALAAAQAVAANHWVDGALIPNPYTEIWDHIKRRLKW